MSVYVISGVSRGIGFGFVKHISENPDNLVISLVRDVAATKDKVSSELGARSNVHILHGDLVNQGSLKQAAAATAEIVGDRGVDYLVANGAYMPLFDAFDPIDELADKPELEEVASSLSRTNIVGNIHLIHHFLPLVLKGRVKKVIAISSGHADLDLINSYGVEVAALYSAYKAATNIIVAKYGAQYKKQGVLFMSMSPGVVDVGHFDSLTPKQQASVGAMVAQFVAYAPDFKGPGTVEDSVRQMLSVWEKANLEDGFGGTFVSHFGTKQWL